MLTLLHIHVIPASFRLFCRSSSFKYRTLFPSILMEILHFISSMSLRLLDPRFENHYLVFLNFIFPLFLAQRSFNPEPYLNIVLGYETNGMPRLSSPSSSPYSMNICLAVLR